MSPKISLDNVSRQHGSAVSYAACISRERIKEETGLSFWKFLVLCATVVEESPVLYEYSFLQGARSTLLTVTSNVYLH